MDVDNALVERCLKSGLVGLGLRHAPPDDWAGATGKWYVIAQPFLGENALATALGTFDVKICTPEDITAQYKAHTGRHITLYEASMLDTSFPTSDALPPLYFCGRNYARLPTMAAAAPLAPVLVRGVVRLTMDNPPVAYWSWVVDSVGAGEMVVARVVQMPGRGGSAFFGVSGARE